MFKAIVVVVVVVNAVIWLGNLILSRHEDKSGAGMVLLVAVPVGILVSLLSLVLIGLLT